ncbi:MAG TPA: DUF6058 family natural product biosynthesis protein, partial [Candidatus Acidoferrales bacterium]|nr:DUF6058 family natural product biosynthesis protein [Candidatus Acidoferrales bacterium]
GSRYVPLDYFEQETDRDRFLARYIAKARELQIEDAERSAPEQWEAFQTGIYGVCLRSVTPENIARKEALIRDIERLIERPADSVAWRQDLRSAVDALDALEMPFSPVYDRTVFGRPPTRDSHIAAVRERFLKE